MGLKEWFGGLTSADKALIGVGGAVATVVSAAIGIAVMYKQDRDEPSKIFKDFQIGVAVTSVIWELFESELNSRYAKNESVMKGVRFIDNMLDKIKIVASSDKLLALTGR